MSSSVLVSRPFAGLLPVHARRRESRFLTWEGAVWLADAHHGMPNASDLVTLVLCADAAIRGTRELVTAELPVEPSSFVRVAAARMQRSDSPRAPTLPLALEWSPERMTLNPCWCDCVRDAASTAQLDRDMVMELNPGALALAIILATQSTPIAAAKLMRRCGSQVTQPFRVRQQAKRWLRELCEAGFRDWGLDSITGVFFPIARIPLGTASPLPRHDSAATRA